MLIKTIVNESVKDAKLYACSCRAAGSENFQNIELNIAETECDNTFTEMLSCEISKYYIHSTYEHDYESSSDAGDGRDECYTEETDLQISLDECIVKDDKFCGVICSAFGEQAFVLIDYPETIISHPNNYGGRNYHSYRYNRFKLIKKAE